MRRLLLIAALGACSGSAGPDRGGERPGPKVVPDAGVSAPDAPLALEDDLPTLATRTAEMIDALAAALDGTDCAVLAGRARAVLDEHRVVRDAAVEATRRGRDRDLDAALEPHTARIAAAITRVRPALAACGGDPGFAEAITPFDL